MDNRVPGLSRFAEILKQSGHVGCPENVRQRIHNPDDAIIEVITGDILEQFAQEGIGVRNQLRRFHTAEILQGGIMQASGKHTVSDGLGIDVGEFTGLDIMYQDAPESFQLIAQAVIGVIKNRGLLQLFIQLQCSGDSVGEQLRFSRHHLRQARCRFDGLTGESEEFS